MEILEFLIPLAVLLAIFFIAGFVWMTKKGQYDDLETPGYRMLLEDNKKDYDKHVNKNQEGEL